VQETKEARKDSCTNKPKNYCCYLCSKQEKCKISCDFLDEQDFKKIDDAIDTNNKEIEKYQKEIGKLSVLHANGKIGEQSFLAATKTLEHKIKRLKEIQQNPSLAESEDYSSRGSEIDDDAFEESEPKRPTALWYLIPFFFGIIGGLIGYVAVKDDDRGMADLLLAFGIGWSVILLIGYWIIFSSLFQF
jgi:hypothetical protein